MIQDICLTHACLFDGLNYTVIGINGNDIVRKEKKLSQAEHTNYTGTFRIQ